MLEAFVRQSLFPMCCPLRNQLMEFPQRAALWDGPYDDLRPAGSPRASPYSSSLWRTLILGVWWMACSNSSWISWLGPPSSLLTM